MATYTPNFSLTMPDYAEPADIAVLNGNTSQIDSLIYQGRRMAVGGYDSTATYNTGDLVEYSNALYRCKEDNVTGNWDSTKWELTTLADEIASKGEGGADVTKEASGNPVEFEDGADAPLVKCTTAIQGNQDLHGYDKPWVGGAGKNKLPLVLADIKARNTSGTWSGNNYTRNGVTFSIITDESENITGIRATGTATANTAIDLSVAGSSGDSLILNGCSSGGGEASYYIGISTLGYKCIGTEVWYSYGVNYLIYCFVVSGYAIPSGGVLFTPMVRLSTVTDPTFEPYSNICPITAYNQSTISVWGGENLFDYNTCENKAITDAGAVYDTGTRLLSVMIDVTANNPYTIVIPQNVVFIGIANYSDSSVFTNRTIYDETGTFVFTPTTPKIRLMFRKPNSDNTIAKADVENLRLYKNSQHTATFSNSIYQGNADFLGGTASGEKVLINLEDLTWGATSGDGRRASNDLISVIKKVNNNLVTSAITNKYPSMSANDLANGSDLGISVNQDGYVQIRTEDPNATPTGQFVYELATPTTETITPTNLPIKSLFGYNHIESTTGDLDVEYITKDFQPIVDLIENSGAEAQAVLYIAPDLSDTEITIDLSAYDEYIIYANDVVVSTQIPQGNAFPKAALAQLTSNATLALYGYDDCSCIYSYGSGKLTYQSGRGGYKITMIVGIKH